jgi:hypothetical protein
MLNFLLSRIRTSQPYEFERWSDTKLTSSTINMFRVTATAVTQVSEAYDDRENCIFRFYLKTITNEPLETSLYNWFRYIKQCVERYS